MTPERDARCIAHLLDPTNPESVAANADLADDLQAGRSVVAWWQVEPTTGARKPAIVVVLGPVPSVVPTGERYAPALLTACLSVAGVAFLLGVAGIVLLLSM